MLPLLRVICGEETWMESPNKHALVIKKWQIHDDNGEGHDDRSGDDKEKEY